MAGQQLFYPPNVAGWDYTRWLNTATFLGRWTAVGQVLQGRQQNPEPSADGRAVRPRRRSSRARSRSGATRRSRLPPEPLLLDFARRALGDANAAWEKQAYPVLVENALRQLIAVSPDLQTA